MNTRLCPPVRPSLLLLIAALAACGGQSQYIANTEVEDTPDNQKILNTLEEYRVALEKRDAGKLILLASEQYWDDAGTPTGTDDYGYTQLKDILATRLGRASDIRYSMRYKTVRIRGNEAYVDVLIDASYTVVDAEGKAVRKDLRDRNQFVLVQEGDDWKFKSGM